MVVVVNIEVECSPKQVYAIECRRIRYKMQLNSTVNIMNVVEGSKMHAIATTCMSM